MKRGLVIAYTGNGKGKTTAALGLAFRALGYGKKIRIIQFIKGEIETGEKIFASKIDDIEIESKGLGFVGILHDKTSPARHYEAAQNALKCVKQALEDKVDIIILDEIFVAIKLKLIEEAVIVEMLKNKKPEQSVVLTGRGARANILKYCDLVTRMQKVKHPFDTGTKAVKSIDY